MLKTAKHRIEGPLMKYTESETLELKKSTSELKEAMMSIVAMLNKHGRGELIFGVKNDGSVCGQQIGEKTIRDISKAIADHIEPRIYPEISKAEIDSKTCILVKFYGSSKPYYFSGKAYIRTGDEDRQLNSRELENMVIEKFKNRNYWDSQRSDTPVGKAGAGAVKKYMQAANIAGRIDFKFSTMHSTIQKLSLCENDMLLNAGKVLFCGNSGLEMQMAIFSGTEKLNFLDIKLVKNNLFELLEQAELYIKQHMNWRVKFGNLEREEIPEIPVKAIREALVNSLCHRDYTAPKGNEVAIFKNRIEIYNPGKFPEGFEPLDFIKGEERSMPSNPLIADILYKSKDIEKWGSGLKRIYDECGASNIKVEYKKLKSGFLVVFYRPEIFDASPGHEIIKSKFPEKFTNNAKSSPEKFTNNAKSSPEKFTNNAKSSPEKINNTALNIIKLIQKNPHIKISEMAINLKITERAIKKALASLKERNLIAREGPNQGGFWKLLQ
jgi:ATP-dependent DNA helicase RecG